MNKKNLISLFLLLTTLTATAQESSQASQRISENLKSCNLVWDSPSTCSMDSMPLSGSRGAGANVWVQDGSIALYLAHNSAYDEQGILRKLGCLRLTPVGIDLQNPIAFRQTKEPATGSMVIEIETKTHVLFKVKLRFLGETLVIDSTSSSDVAWDAAYVMWREVGTDEKDTPLPTSHHGPIRWCGVSEHETITPVGGALLFIHENKEAVREMDMAKNQNVPSSLVLNVLPERNFGGALVAQGGLTFAEPTHMTWQHFSGKAWTGRTASARSHVLAVAIGAAKNASTKEWEASARSLLKKDNRIKAEKAEDKRWQDFWNRSYVFISSQDETKEQAAQITRNYQLFREMLACNQGGEFPLKFNGGIYTTDNFPERIKARLNPSCGFCPEGGPDYRRWDQMFMQQNQRWLGWPAIPSGDEDLVKPSISFYRNRFPIAEARAKGLGAQGACFTEGLGIEGTTYVSPNPQGLCAEMQLVFHFSSSIEHAWMAFQAHNTLGLNIDADIPWLVGIVRFYDTYYRNKCKELTKSELDAKGKLVIYPANGMELWCEATNPIEVVIGLNRITEGLLALKNLPTEDKNYLLQVQKTLPNFITVEKNGKTVLAPAVKWERLCTPWECTEFFAAFPYRRLGVTQPKTLPVLRNTWDAMDEKSLSKQGFSWQPDVANAASLGDAAEAKKRIIFKLSDAASSSRYPAFFGPGHDWTPDHNWGGTGMVGLQEMLIASDPSPNGKIYLLPAWPKEWNVNFRLHTSGQTTVDCCYENGKITTLKVYPMARIKDVVLPK